MYIVDMASLVSMHLVVYDSALSFQKQGGCKPDPLLADLLDCAQGVGCSIMCVCVCVCPGDVFPPQDELGGGTTAQLQAMQVDPPMYDHTHTNTSLGPRPSPLRDLLRAFNCVGEGNIENGEGLG